MYMRQVWKQFARNIFTGGYCDTVDAFNGEWFHPEPLYGSGFTNGFELLGVQDVDCHVTTTVMCITWLSRMQVQFLGFRLSQPVYVFLIVACYDFLVCTKRW